MFRCKGKQSGTSIRSKHRISKKGNRNLRKAMHLTSLSVVKYNKNHKELYNRVGKGIFTLNLSQKYFKRLE
jgi:hypothetical protein